MVYSKKQLIEIDDAMSGSRYYLEMAYHCLEHFISDYIDNAGEEELIFALQAYPQVISSLLNAVLTLLTLSLTEIDKYSKNEEWTVTQVRHNFDEIMAIKKIYQEKTEE